MDLRSLSVIDFAEHTNIPLHIIGMGATGSRVFEQLVCMGATNIHCYDGDVVEPHNIHNQLYIMDDVNMRKTEAAYNWYQQKHRTSTNRALPPDSMTFNDTMVWRDDAKDMNGIVFLLTDDFRSRKEIMEGIVAGGNCAYVIETRTAPHFYECRVINPNSTSDVEKFYESLGSDDDEDAYISACGTSINCGVTMTACACTAVWTLINLLSDHAQTSPRLNHEFQPMNVIGNQPL